jgi:choline dehydrogenase-like flavoprotein
MTHIAWQENQRDIVIEVDVVVVGSGAGGSACAVALARHGLKVAIVEAGAWRDPADYPSSMFGALRDLYDNFGSNLARGRALWPIVQGRTVGGGTVINSAIVVHTPSDIFDTWQQEHGFGGNWQDELWAHQETLDQELKVQTTHPDYMGKNNTLAIHGAKALNLHDHDMLRNVDQCVGSGFCGQGCRQNRKQSTNINFIPETLDKNGVMVSCAPVSQICFKGTKAVGVQGRFEHPRSHKKGARFKILARHSVVVAASATHSPALLLRSKLRLPALGHYFRAHPGIGVFGSYDDPVVMNHGATQGWSSLVHRESRGIKYETLSVAPELLASRLGGAGAPLMERLADHPHLAMWVWSIRAKAIGRVTLGFGGGPSVRYGLGEEDMLVFRQAAHTTARMHIEAGARWVLPGVYGLPYRLRPDELHLLENAPTDPRAWTAILSHLFGGCVMGTNKNVSVCDPNGRVWDTDNLWIADASSIPTTLGVNPQHTIMALARMRADRIAESQTAPQ